MSTFYLIRHATNDFVGKVVVGWTPGVSLNAEGREQAGRLAWKLLGRGITTLYSSPLERALETAGPIGEALGLRVQVRDALGEVRFGDWSGKRMDELERDPRWRLFQEYRSGTRAPSGELMVESQMRIVNELEHLRARHPEETIAVVSHADIIRAALVYYAGIPIDLNQRIEISPASISILTLNDRGPQILRLNDTAE
ncbi:MAG: histidine phosphatase family protein [Acidobacteriia bacterium]|nr:histidine phosphatase family protein [Terriglobia bacterium]